MGGSYYSFLFPPGRTAKLRNDILMFQQHQGESLSEAWTPFKDLLQKVPHHGINQKRPNPLSPKNVNSISLARRKEERNNDNDVAIGDDIEKPTRTEMGMLVKETEKENEAENGIKSETIRRDGKEETTEAPSS
ncbi:zinc finger, CCHC-type containing protein [Tanacetum coccineum]